MRSVFAIALLAILAALTMTVQIQPTKATTLIVGPTGYSTIQDAVDAANPHDTIFVTSGTYREHNIIINTPYISLIGEDRDDTTIDAGGAHAILQVRAARDIVIRGFTIKNASTYGIYHAEMDGELEGIDIFDNIITNISLNGIALRSVRRAKIHGNDISFCGESGIELWKGGECKIWHNNFIDNDYHAADEEHCLDSNEWNAEYPLGGNYWNNITLPADDYSGAYQNETGSDGICDEEVNNSCGMIVGFVDHYPLKRPWAIPDVSVSEVAPFKTVISQGYTTNVSVTVANSGKKVEGISLAIFANDTFISEQDVILPRPVGHDTESIFTFQWNTAGWLKGKYNVTSELELDCEECAELEDASDNSRKEDPERWPFLTLPGDVDGDRDVDIYDIIIISAAYGSQKGESNYNPNCDIDDDGDVDIFDLLIAQDHYGQSW